MQSRITGPRPEFLPEWLLGMLGTQDNHSKSESNSDTESNEDRETEHEGQGEGGGRAA